MLILKEKLLLSVQQKASQDANVDASLDQAANIELALDIFNSFLFQAQLPVLLAAEGAVENVLAPGDTLERDQTGLLVELDDIFRLQGLAQSLIQFELSLQ